MNRIDIYSHESFIPNNWYAAQMSGKEGAEERKKKMEEKARQADARCVNSPLDILTSP